MLCVDLVLLTFSLLGVLRALGQYFPSNLEYFGLYFFKILFCPVLLFSMGTPNYMYIRPFLRMDNFFCFPLQFPDHVEF